MLHILLAFAFSSQPQFIQMNLDLKIQGKKLNTIKTLAETGKKQVLTQKIDKDTITIELTPKVENGDELHLAFKVLQNKKVLTSPEVITFDQQEAFVEMDENDNSKVELSVIPKIL